MPKSNIKFQNLPKNATKKREMAPLLTFPRYSVKFCEDFTPDRIFFTPTLLAHWYIFASLTFGFPFSTRPSGWFVQWGQRSYASPHFPKFLCLTKFMRDSGNAVFNRYIDNAIILYILKTTFTGSLFNCTQYALLDTKMIAGP